MPRLIWTPASLRDIQRLYRFLNAKNPAAARRAVNTIRAGVRHLGRYPETGRPASAANVNMREVLVPFGRDGYVILYRVEGDGLHLLAVRHGREAGY